MTFHAPQIRKTRSLYPYLITRRAKTLASAFVLVSLTACATAEQPVFVADEPLLPASLNNSVTDLLDASTPVANNTSLPPMQPISDSPALSTTGNTQGLAETSLTDAVAIDATAFNNAAVSAPGLNTLGTGAERKRALRALAERSVRRDHPGQYTVVRGDTLWDISERFLSRPWLWPEIWHVNPQIENPHLIYPGDRIALTYVNGQPRLQLIRASSSSNGKAISNFPLTSVENFLIEPRVVEAGDLERAPYVVSTEDDRLIASIGNHIYARGNLSDARYSIYRPGDTLIDPDTKEVLGHEAIHVSKASMVKAGDPSKLIITRNNRETLVGDRLMPMAEKATMNFQPRTADIGKTGKIISLFDAIARAGQYQVVVLNLGNTDGIQQGDVLSVFGNDRQVRDVVSQKKNDWVTIEGEKAGVVMVFRAFDRVSYALVMSSHRTINLYDRVGSGQL